MFRVAIFQAGTALIIAAAGWAMGDARSAATALLCGAACAVPNALLATHLNILTRWQDMPGTHAASPDVQAGQARTYAAAMLFGEFLKVALTVALLALAVLAYHRIVWKALVLTLCACLFVQPFVLNRRTRLQ